MEEGRRKKRRVVIQKDESETNSRIALGRLSARGGQIGKKTRGGCN